MWTTKMRTLAFAQLLSDNEERIYLPIIFISDKFPHQSFWEVVGIGSRKG